MILLWASTVFAMAVMVLSVLKLTRHFDNFKPIERAGLGVMAGAAAMTTPARLSSGPTPFDDWSVTLLWIGISLYLAGKYYRLWIHRRRNAEQAASGEQWLKDRGKWP